MCVGDYYEIGAIRDFSRCHDPHPRWREFIHAGCPIVGDRRDEREIANGVLTNSRAIVNPIAVPNPRAILRTQVQIYGRRAEIGAHADRQKVNTGAIENARIASRRECRARRSARSSLCGEVESIAIKRSVKGE